MTAEEMFRRLRFTEKHNEFDDGARFCVDREQIEFIEENES